MLTIGLDLSINSTGITINNNSELTFYLIVPKLTKKMVQYGTDYNINYIQYEKTNSDSDNIREIGRCIENILVNLSKSVYIDLIVIEDIALSARSNSIITLSLLNGYIRCVCDKLSLKYITVPPTSWKKKLLGNGQANKELIVYHFNHLFPLYKDCPLKLDDISDSYFLSIYSVIS